MFDWICTLRFINNVVNKEKTSKGKWSLIKKINYIFDKTLIYASQS